MTRASLLFAGEVGEETAERGVILPLCILCDSEASEAMVDAGQQVTCPICQRYILAEGLAADLAEENDWPQFRSKLARAVRWQFYRNGQQPVKLRSATSAEWLVASLEVFEEDPERRERAAVEAFVSAGLFEDIWDEPITMLSRALGRSREQSRLFAEDLEARGIVRIVTYETRQLEGETSLTRTPLKQWVRCGKKYSAKSAGSE